MALRAMDTAKGLFYEGTSERDPAWSWWISERGFDHATGAMLGGLGDWKAAIEPVQRAMETAPGDAHRDRFLYLCVLLHAQLEAGAWRDGAMTAERLVPYIGQVRSARPPHASWRRSATRAVPHAPPSSWTRSAPSSTP